MDKPSRKHIEYCLKISTSIETEFSANTSTRYISNELGYGHMLNKKFKINYQERKQLIKWLEHHGIDGRAKKSQLDGGYIDVATSVVDEKLSKEAVSKYWIKIKSLGSRPVKINNIQIKLPEYAHLALDYRLIKSIQCDWIVLVENLAAFDKFEKFLINSFPDASILAVFRGSPQSPYGYQWVKGYVEKNPKINLAICGDFDPAGIEIALTARPDAVILPKLEMLNNLKSNAYDYNNQAHQQHRLKSSLFPELKPWVIFLDDKKGGYTQERLIANCIPLEFIRL